MSGTVRTEQHGRVLLATLSNPPHGLFDDPLVVALSALVERAETDEGVGAVVLTGDHPERFLAHYDVAELLQAAEESPSLSPGVARASLRLAGALRKVPGSEQALGRTSAAGLVAIERFHETMLRMESCGAVFIAAINGSAQGGGCELSLACDFRWMAAGDHLIGQPEILFGFPPGGGGTQRLARMLGTSKALRLVLDGGPLSPDEALEIGIVDRILPAGELVEAVMREAERLAGRPKAGVAAAKRSIYFGGSLPLADGMRLERAEFLATLPSEDAKAAMRAYVEALERTGELPGYDRDAMRAAVERGRFT
ncbi:MAG: enoyl-CoA hydratase/isomerase family protein [Actinomycetota bacterium]|nr:enoyl-CoA hydratase/isomerase family protein [Actinomycetota bacterium]